MASINNILFLLAILVSFTVILAQNSGTQVPSPDKPSFIPPLDVEGISELLSLPHLLSALGIHGHLSFKPPKLELPQIPGVGLFVGESRLKRSPADSTQLHVINCNFQTEGGFKCTSCHEVRHCYPINRGIVYTCSGLLPYCRNGQCSRTKGALCTSISTSSATIESSFSSTGSTDTSSSSSSYSSSSLSSSSSSSSSTSTTTAAP